MGRRIVLIGALGLAALAAAGCATALERELAVRALRPPASLVCADGAPVRILVDAACPRGLCGWSCEPDRW